MSSSETIALGQLVPDQSCSPHTCGRAGSPIAGSSPIVSSAHLADSPHRGASVLLGQEVPVYEVDDGASSRSCMRKLLITIIMILIICILVVIILRSIF